MRAEGEYTGGHCHTYNPTKNSFADEGFYAKLGNKTYFYVHKGCPKKRMAITSLKYIRN